MTVRRLTIVAGALGCLMAPAAHAAPTTGLETTTSTARVAPSGLITFRVKKLRGVEVRRASIRTSRGTRRVSAWAVERAASKGRLAVRLPRSWSGRTARLRVQPVLGAVTLARRPKVPTTTLPVLEPASSSGTCAVDLSQMVDGKRPPACWRPYADSSPFNQSLPATPRVASNSLAVVQRVLGFGPLQHMTGGGAGDPLDAGRPMYVSKPTDPVFTVHCNEPWGSCDVEGARVRIPDAARIPGEEDKHLTVVDPSTGVEWDFWHVSSKPQGGGTLQIGWGGKTSITGDGLGSDAVAAKTATMAGVVRAEELAGGQINHALALFVHCDSGKYVFPATKGGMPCADIGESPTNAPAMGTRFQLDMTAAEIDALPVPAYRKTVFRAMAKYGMYVIDTGGTWGVVPETGLVTASFGLSEVWEDYAKSVGAEFWGPDDRYVFNLRDGVDWSSKLRVIDPCVAQRTC